MTTWLLGRWLGTLLGSVVAAAVVLSGAPAFAQAKLGFVDMQKALISVQEGKAAKAKLDKAVKEKQREFDKMQDELKKMKDDLEQQAALMKEDLKRQKLQEYQKRLMELQDFYMANQRDLAEEEGKLTKPIFERFDKIIKKIGKDEGYTLVVEKAAVVYASGSIDLTDKLIKEFNAGGGK